MAITRFLRRRFEDVTEAMERRIIAKPFLDTNGEKGLWAAIARAPRHRVVRQRIAVEGWPSTPRPLRVVFLSDLHTGSHSDDLARLAGILDEAARLQPDVACLGGDYINGMLFGRGRIPPEVIAEKLSSLQPPLGSFAILGDHDELFGAERVARALRTAGLTVLVNDVRRVAFEGAAIHLVGLTPDARALPDLLETVPPGAPAIVLAHDPAAFAQLPRGPYLMLSGHTHGGQVQLPGLGPFVNMSDAPLRWSYGPIAEAGRHLYVTSGLGTSFVPFRLLIPPEIAVIEIGAHDPAGR
ncbi:MAG TPA: metallophosphoesterase [Microvirga sp.]|nr:metallophosphoesterase [Microvirga sp.]